MVLVFAPVSVVLPAAALELRRKAYRSELLPKPGSVCVGGGEGVVPGRGSECQGGGGRARVGVGVAGGGRSARVGVPGPG